MPDLTAPADLWEPEEDPGEDLAPDYEGPAEFDAELISTAPGGGAVLQAVSEAAMTADFVIVTRGKRVNRNSSMVQITAGPNGGGMLTDEWERNPLVLWNHGNGYDLPVGTAEDQAGKVHIKKAGRRAVSRWHCPTSPAATADGFAPQLFGLVAERILRGASIGFMPRKAMLAKKEAEEKLPEGVEKIGGWRGVDYTEFDLWEWSLVPIGADPDALRQAVEKRRCGQEKMGGRLAELLRPHAAARPAWSPGAAWTPADRFGVAPDPAPSATTPFPDLIAATAAALRHRQEAREQARVLTRSVLG